MNTFLKMSYLSNLFNLQGKNVENVDGYEELQKRITEKRDYIDKALTNFNSFIKHLKECLNKSTSFQNNFQKIKCVEEEKGIHDMTTLVVQKVAKNLEENYNILSIFINSFGSYLSKLNKEISLYDDFKKINKDLNEEKDKLKKSKDEYNKCGQEAEIKIKEFAEKNLQNLSRIRDSQILLDQIENITRLPKNSLVKYRTSIRKANELITKYNYKQTEIFNIIPEIRKEDEAFGSSLMKAFLQHLENENQSLNLKIDEINKLKFQENNKMKELIDGVEINKKDEKQKNLIHYQTSLDIIKCQNKEEFELRCATIFLINNFIDGSIFPSYNYEQEKKHYHLTEIIKKLFDEKGEIDSNLSEDFLNSISDPSVHKFFFSLLSQFRTNNRFERSKYLIDLLAKGFNFLLDNAEKNKLYDNVKHSIILAQTFFYTDENNKKVYIIEYIKNHKWIKTASFWRLFIEDQVKKEFLRFEKVFPDANFSVENNVNLNKKVMEKLNEVVFSQLLTFISNMGDFEIDKRIILKIVDECIEKYNYLSKTNIDSLYELITEGKVDIEQLRKEYSPSLEEELINKNNNENEEKPKENNESVGKEEKKEDSQKEEEKKEEVKKEDEKKEEEKKEEEKVNDEQKTESNNTNNEEKKEDDNKTES